MSGPEQSPTAGEPGVEPAPPAFHERLVPSPATWLTAPGAAVGAALVVWPVDPLAGVLAAVAVGALVAGGLWQAGAVVRVQAGVLHAGRASVPVALLGPATAHRGADARHERGPGLDARAHLCIRGWVDPVVRVRLDDPQDPTPYWVVSSRDPDGLVAALTPPDP